MSDEPAQQLIVLIPVKTISITNRREHWAIRANRTRHHRRIAAMLVGTAIKKRGTPIAFPLVIDMVRLASRRMDDDNLRAALKALRAGIADALGVDDADKRLTWNYFQSSYLASSTSGVMVSLYNPKGEICNE